MACEARDGGDQPLKRQSARQARTTDHGARPFAGDLPAFEHRDPVDPHPDDSHRRQVRIFIGRPVGDLCRIKKHQIRVMPGRDQSAICDACLPGGQRTDPADAFLETQDTTLADVVAEETREGAVAARMRHASADEAVVRLETVDDMLRVTIRDNGAGFNPQAAARPTALGLLSMRERAAAIGATFAVMARPGDGTTVTIERRLEPEMTSVPELAPVEELPELANGTAKRIPA